MPNPNQSLDDPELTPGESAEAPEIPAEEALPDSGGTAEAEADSAMQAGPALPWNQYERLRRFDGKPMEDVLREIDHDYEVMGRHKAEVAEARQRDAEWRRQLTELVGARTRPEVESPTAKEMSETEMNLFFDQFQRNPTQAFNDYLMPRLLPQIRENLLNEVLGQIEPRLQGQAQAIAVRQEFAALDKAHPGWRDHEARMREIMERNPALDAQPYEDIFNLAQLENSKEHYLTKDVTYFMARGLPFDESKQIALLRHSQPAATKDTPPGTLPTRNVAAPGKRTSTKPGTTPPAVGTMEELAELVKAEQA